MFFRDREDAARKLAEELKGRTLRHPLVLGVPRGGVVIAAILAGELHAELDIVLSRKLRAPGQPELAIGAVSEEGEVYLNPYAERVLAGTEGYLEQEKRHQLSEINRRKKVFRAVRPKASVQGRSVIVTDDGIATGSTILAALQVVKNEEPYEVIVAAPVAAPDRLKPIRKACDEVVCLYMPEDFYAIGQFYADFRQVEDDEVIELLRQAMPTV